MVKRCSHDENDLLIDIFLQLANEYEKSLTQIKDALLIEENEPIILRFWEIYSIGFILRLGIFEDEPWNVHSST